MRISIGVILATLLVLSSNIWAENGPKDAELAPTTTMGPAEVVQIVIDSLRTNDPAEGDSGIATVWRFAAPSNKALTGPLQRFTVMLKSGYGDMLNHIDSEYGPIEIENDFAMQPVWLTTPGGDEVGYMFHVRRQSAGNFEGMWMTESVYPIAPKKPGTTI